jgi:hypothetical protein
VCRSLPARAAARALAVGAAMQCLLVGAGVRVLSAAVTLVSGIGKEVLLEAGPDGLILRALNDGRSTFCEARLQAGLFAQYSAPPAGGPASLKVKLLARPLRGVFKALRGCESVRLYFASAGGAGAQAHYLVLQLKDKLEVTRTHSLHYEDCEMVEAAFDRAAALHFVVARPAILK